MYTGENMQFVGDAISKIEATRADKQERPMQIKANVKIIDVQKKELFAANEKKDGIAISYNFGIEYGEKSGKIVVEGMIFVLGEKKEMKKLEDEWIEKNKVEGELIVPVLNRAMELGYLVAIPVAKELKLNVPLRMPRFVPKDNAATDPDVKADEASQAG